MKFALKTAVLFILYGSTCGEMFASVEQLRHLHEKETTAIIELKYLINSLKEYCVKLEKQLKYMQMENKVFSQDTEKYIINPLNAFLLIKRLSYDMENVESDINKITNKFHQNMEQVLIPMSDFEGAVEGFLRLQKTYELKSNDLANGIIEDKKFRKAMSADDLFALGKYLVKFDANFGIEYLVLALNKNKFTLELPTLMILQEILATYRKLKNYTEAIKIIDEMLKIEPDNEELESLKVELEVLLLFEDEEIETDVEDYSGSHFSTAKDLKLYAQSCIGQRRQNVSVTSKLYCFMDSKNSFTKIAPFKVEVMNFDPYVAIFNDFISDSEISVLKEISARRFSRASILLPNSTVSTSNIRVAKLCWHYDGSHKIINTLNKRANDMTGLNMATAEMWQVQNYGIGGHYSPHFDFSNKGQDFHLGTGNRIATTLVYLSDVEKGGATVFPFLRIKLDPRKGSALFWYNLNTSGNREFLSYHAACPVLVGNKWVANKWFHEYGQEFIRPCGLHEIPAVEDYKEKFYII